MSFPPAGEWNLIDTVITGSGGRASFNIPDEHKLDVGVYPTKMVVRSVVRQYDVISEVNMTSFPQ
jgi:hypothetical protein